MSCGLYPVAGTTQCDAGLRLSLTQLSFQHFTGRAHRQRLPDLDVPRYLKAAICSRLQATSSAAVSDAPARSTTYAFTSSPSRSSGTPTTAARRDRRMRHEHVLDLARIHVEAAAQDHVLLAIDDRQIPVGVELADVAGPEPPRSASAVASGRS